MSVHGTILLIEDDLNDLDVIQSALLENGVKNEIRMFTGAKAAMDYLSTTLDLPFLILCDIRLHEINGLAFRSALNSNDYLRKKSIPFLFLTGAASQQIVDEAYDLTVQGFFKKPQTYPELKAQLANIINYWKDCLHPNSF